MMKGQGVHTVVAPIPVTHRVTSMSVGSCLEEERPHLFSS